MAVQEDDDPPLGVEVWQWLKSNLPTMLVVGGLVTSAITMGYGQALRLVQMESKIDANRASVEELALEVLTAKVIDLSLQITRLEALGSEMQNADRTLLTQLYEQRRVLERRISDIGR